MKKYLLSLFSVFYILTIQAQEKLVPLQVNPVIAKQHSASIKQQKKSADETPILNLPFFEDFSKGQGYPNSEIWSDDKAYVNNGFGIFPPNWGVATFDALDSAGKIYANATYTSFEADHLTSHSIRLDSVFQPIKKAIQKSDSLYFSFFYQPQGRGNMPQQGDSLILEFFSPLTGLWNQVWSSEGMPLDTFKLYNKTWFKQVSFPITDSAAYYSKDFKFRFINFASIANQILPSWQSSMDQWNVDYIYLNVGRSKSDTIYRDLSFVDVDRSFLKNYTVMPYYHYSNDPTNEMRDSLHNTIINLDTTSHTTTYRFLILDKDGNEVDQYYGGSYSLTPYYQDGYVAYQPFAKPRISRILPIDPFAVIDSTFFTIRHILIGDYTVNDRLYDTLDIKQEFSNYFAYDDGIPEAGYGLSPAGAQGALKFTLNVKDTLRGVRIYFNHTKTEGNSAYFYLNVWDDNNGLPGDYLNPDTLVKAEFGDTPNDFQTFIFDEGIAVRNTFFIGWEQTTNDNLNIGFDRTIDNGSKLYYNTNGQWLPSDFKGSLMIRPIVGDPIAPRKSKPTKSSTYLSLSPNPLTINNLNISVPSELSKYASNDLLVELFNLTGQKVLEMPYRPTVSLNGVSMGVYMLRVVSKDGHAQASSKLIISK